MLPSAIRHRLTLATTFVLLLIFVLPLAAQAQSSLPAKQTPSPLRMRSHSPSVTATSVTISSTTGWQQTPLTVQQGNQFTISYVSGTWTVDVNNWPYVGPDGYPPNIDKQIYQGCKYDSSYVYATLLGEIGNSSDFAVSRGGTFTASQSGTLSLRINDQDGCLADNGGSVTMTVDTSQSLTVNQVWTTDNNFNPKTSFAPGDAIYYMVQVTNTNSTTVTATFTFLATGPQQIFYWSGSVSVPTGTVSYYYPTTVPTSAPQGGYTLTISVTYNGVSSQGQSQFTVTNNKVNNAIAWAKSQLGSKQWNGLCEKFVENAYGTTGQYLTAQDAYNALHTSTNWSPDIGALVWFVPNKGNGWSGHVGIYLGNDQFISATYNGVKIQDMKNWSKNIARYEGWGDAPSSWPGR